MNTRYNVYKLGEHVASVNDETRPEWVGSRVWKFSPERKERVKEPTVNFFNPYEAAAHFLRVHHAVYTFFVSMAVNELDRRK